MSYIETLLLLGIQSIWFTSWDGCRMNSSLYRMDVIVDEFKTRLDSIDLDFKLNLLDVSLKYFDINLLFSTCTL